MSDIEGLRRLALEHGIEPTWRDVFEREHQVPESSLRALLRAMGVAADDDLRVQEALIERRRRLWRRPLPLVVVVREKDLPARTVLRLPAAERNAPLELQLTHEDGRQESHVLVPDGLERLEDADVDSVPHVAWRLELPRAALGYHRVRLVRDGGSLAELTYIVTPERCFEPEAVRGKGRVWGPALQVYALRSQRNWGIGDFTDLRATLEQWAARGAGVIGISPLHALFPHAPERASPYSPSNRLFLQTLYLDPERIEDFRESEAARAMAGSAELQRRLAELRARELVDYTAVAEIKRGAFELAYACFRERHLARDTPRARAFRRFLEERGRPLELHATFEALQEKLHREDPRIWGWPVWPEEYRDPDSPAVRRFREENRERVEFYAYLQWQAELQLAELGARALELRTGVGLYGDLAVSMDRGGSESWMNQRALASGVSIGAPPDEFNPAGQDWGLPPFIAERLQETGYAPIIALLRSTMRHNGAVRIDHVMMLHRLYWVPLGASPAEGAYVRYPLHDLLGIVALESQRNSCLVVGEDLGTVAAEVREALRRYGVLSYRLLIFERDEDGRFLAPDEYPAQALAAVSTHDLPTLAGFWEGRDLIVRQELGQFPSEEIRQKQIVARAQARAQLLIALDAEGLLPPGATVDPGSVPTMTPALACNVHAFVARTPARLMTIQLEDVMGVLDQVNLPGTTDDLHPNWRRKLPLDIESLGRDERFLTLTETMRRERPSPRPRTARASAPPAAIVPRATYRLQLNREFTFAAATEVVPYLAALGMSHVYCSPYFRARPGSTHGYDVVDHNALNPEIGSPEDFERFCDALRAHGLGQILDIVPNHVGIMGADNPWWMDVLENGEASVYAQFFDIDWLPSDPALAHKVLVPVLGDQYGVVLESGELELRFERERGSFAVCYHDHRFPIDPRLYPRILEIALRIAPPEPAGTSAVTNGAARPWRAEFESLIAAFGHLPARENTDPAAVAERNRDEEVHKRRLAALCAEHPELCTAIEAAVRSFAGEPGRPASFEPLHELLEAQAYRLAFWRVAADEINYRRFFDVNELAALRMENEAVFEATHRLVFDLLKKGRVAGLRVDHPDGLYDPRQYFQRLQDRMAALSGSAPVTHAKRALPLYLLAEKITASFERLPEDWPVHGTTGYHFANVATGLLVDSAARSRFDRIYRAFIGEKPVWSDVVYDAKHLILRTSLAAELSVVANQLARIARANPRTRDFTRASLRQALAEVIACFPVYRTYVGDGASAEDRRYIDWAVACARARTTAVDQEVFDFVRAALLTELETPDEESAQQVHAFARKFQQVTAPAAAKGVEDTALYRFNRLVALNEVGGEPDTFGITVRAFHGDARQRARRWPHEMLSTSTHDTKRSEDVRARIAVLSEMPGQWRDALERWSRINRSRKREVNGEPAPSRNDEYLLYQTLLGTWPHEDPRGDALVQYRERIETYMLKAAREAKLQTSWSRPDAQYEEALRQFVQALLDPREGNLFLPDFLQLERKVARFGALNGLSQTLCKLTAPGVPDIYQGNELWDFSLVDPDNRRPVDYARRRTLLGEIHQWAGLTQAELAAKLRALAASPQDDRAKLFVTSRTLEFRRAHEALFRDGEYLPLRTIGPRAAHLCAYARRRRGELAVVLIPRLYSRLLAGSPEPPLGRDTWQDTGVELPAKLASAALENVFDGVRVAVRELESRRVLLVAEALAAFPVALLTGAMDAAATASINVRTEEGQP